MKAFLFSFLAMGTALASSSFELQSVKVTGAKNAQLEFTGAGTLPNPLQTVQDGTIELTFIGVEISEALQGKLDLDAPHTLIQRVSVYSPEKGTVKAKIIVNGSTEALKDRFTFTRGEKGLIAKVEYPKAESATLQLLKEEQEPLQDLKSPIKAVSPKIPVFQFVLVALVILMAGGATLFGFKTLKKRGVITGSRKYLIEQLGHVALGNKSGVSLLRVGREFVLVGVTPEQVTLLSNLPRLQEQYEEDTRFERGAFREAVQEETLKMRTASA